MSDYSVNCQINNGLSGTISLASVDPNDDTSWVNSTGNSAIPSGQSGGFTASGDGDSGCGGTVNYTLPNGDLLVILYNTSKSYGNAYCVALLQSGNPDSAGTDAYFCSPDNVSTTTASSISVSINMWAQ